MVLGGSGLIAVLFIIIFFLLFISLLSVVALGLLKAFHHLHGPERLFKYFLSFIGFIIFYYFFFYLAFRIPVRTDEFIIIILVSTYMFVAVFALGLILKVFNAHLNKVRILFPVITFIIFIIIFLLSIEW